MRAPITALALLLAASATTIASPTDHVQELQRRALTDYITNLVNGVSVGDLTQGILQDFWNWIPSTDDIKSRLGITDQALLNAPLEVLNIPGYANWSGNTWNLRMRGQAYKQVISNNGNTRIVSDAVLDNAANVFLPNLDIDQLPADQQANARNLTSAVLSFPQDDVQLQFTLDVREPRDPKLADWTALVVWPSKTDSRGEFDGWIPLPQVPPAGGNAWLPDGSQITTITALDVHTIGTNTGNSTAYLVPPDGIIVVSDIDDVLRVTKVYQPTEGLLNTFARNFVPWLNMPDIYAGWSSQHPDRPYHFHYLTTTPEQGTRVYMEFIYNNYPLGSFDTRPLNFTNLDLTFAVRKFLLDRIFQTFPRRQFVLVGDITNPDVMQDYPTMAKTYGNVACILIRNVTSTDSNNAFPYDTSEFEGLRAGSFMFFRTPDDIAGLDFANGACVNSSVPQQVTYGWQNLPLGITLRSAGGRVRGERLEWVWGVVVGGLVSWLML